MKEDIYMTETEWEDQMACKVLAYTKDALFVDLRYMGRAFQIMTPQADRQITTLAADGEVLHYSSGAARSGYFKKNDKISGSPVSSQCVSLSVPAFVDRGTEGAAAVGACRL